MKTKAINPTLSHRNDWPRGTLAYYRNGEVAFAFMARFTEYKAPSLTEAQRYLIHGKDFV